MPGHRGSRLRRKADPELGIRPGPSSTTGRRALLGAPPPGHARRSPVGQTAVVSANAFDPVPSRREAVAVARRGPAGVVTGYAVGEKGAVPRALGIDRAGLASLGFEGKLGQAVRVPGSGTDAVAIGVGSGKLTAAQLRDVAAAYAGCVSRESALAIDVLGASGSDRADAGQALVEGVLLARYRYTPLKSKDETVAVAS